MRIPSGKMGQASKTGIPAMERSTETELREEGLKWVKEGKKLQVVWGLQRVEVRKPRCEFPGLGKLSHNR